MSLCRMCRGCNHMCYEMKNGFYYCEGFICLHVNKCISPNEFNCNQNCPNYSNCSACRYEPDDQYDTCRERPTLEELMENGRV